VCVPPTRAPVKGEGVQVMMKFACVDLRKIVEALSRQPEAVRIEKAAQLRAAITSAGAAVLGLSDEDTGSNAAALIRRIGATISFLRGLEQPGWEPPARTVVDGEDVTGMRLDLDDNPHAEVQSQAEEHARRGKKSRSA
jgi:hypothetical protein